MTTIGRHGTGIRTTPGTLTRWKLTEPVRLYAYTLLSVLILGLVLAGVASGQWGEYLTAAVGAVLTMPGAIEAARASVYSPASVVQEMRRVAEHVS